MFDIVTLTREQAREIVRFLSIFTDEHCSCYEHDDNDPEDICDFCRASILEEYLLAGGLRTNFN